MRKQGLNLNDLTPSSSRFDSTTPPSDFDNHVYFGTRKAGGVGLVYKVATGNAGGPSNTAPSVINTVETTNSFFDGVVRLSWRDRPIGRPTGRGFEKGIQQKPGWWCLPLTPGGIVISFFQQVDRTNGMGYWVSYTTPIRIAKTSGNAGSTPMVGASLV